MSLSHELKAALDGRATLPDFTPDEVQKALSRPDSFAYFGGNEEMFKTWALGPVIRHRDSPVLDKSNAAALRKALESVPEWAGQWEAMESNHWAVGWVEHLSYRVLDDAGCSTTLARFIRAWFDHLRDDYPVADDDAYSEAEVEEAERTWKGLNIKERVELCKRYGVNVLAARRDYPPHDDQGGIQDYLTSP